MEVIDPRVQNEIQLFTIKMNLDNDDKWSRTFNMIRQMSSENSAKSNPFDQLSESEKRQYEIDLNEKRIQMKLKEKIKNMFKYS